jgi:hypothetical protein
MTMDYTDYATVIDLHPWTDQATKVAMAAAIDAFTRGTWTDETIITRLGQAFAESGGYRDSFDRETAFALAAEVTGIDYNDIYDAWLVPPAVWGEAL